MTENTTTTELRQLQQAWQEAVRGYDVDDDHSVRREQAARDALIDYIEDHGLNYSEHDPRPFDNDAL